MREIDEPEARGRIPLDIFRKRSDVAEFSGVTADVGCSPRFHKSEWKDEATPTDVSIPASCLAEEAECELSGAPPTNHASADTGPERPQTGSGEVTALDG